jgi:hypothetical protein
VVNEKHEIVGILSLSDLVRTAGIEASLIAAALQSICQPAHRQTADLMCSHQIEGEQNVILLAAANRISSYIVDPSGRVPVGSNHVQAKVAIGYYAH